MLQQYGGHRKRGPALRYGGVHSLSGEVPLCGGPPRIVARRLCGALRTYGETRSCGARLRLQVSPQFGATASCGAPADNGPTVLCGAPAQMKANNRYNNKITRGVTVEVTPFIFAST